MLHEELMDFDGSSPQMSAISPESKESATSPQSANQRILESQWQPGRKSLSINDSSSRPMQPLKLRYHSGPIDHRALTNRFPTELIQDIQAIVRENGMMIRSSASESTSFKLKVVRPRQIVTVSQPVEQAQMKLGSSGSNSSLFQNQQQFMEDVYPVSRDPDAMSTHSRSSATSRHQQRPIRPDVGIKRVVRVSDDDSLSNNNTNRSNASFAAADKSGSNNNNASSRFARVISSLPMSLIRRVKYMAKHGSSWNKGFDGSTEDASRRFEVAGNHHETASCSTPEDMSMQQIEDELRFYIEIQKIKNLKGLYVVEFKRRNGDIWLFKKMYQELLAQLPLGESDIF